MTRSVYRPGEYWEELLDREFSIRGVAYPTLPASFNELGYAAMRRAVERALVAAGHPDAGRDARVLDIGPGTGYWLDFWTTRGATELTALELTEASACRLRKRYPESRIVRGDISAAELPSLGTFDVVSAMSVLLHVVDDSAFSRAVENTCASVAPQGALVIIDPILVHGWYGPALDPGANSVARPLAQWKEALGRHGMTVRALEPVTALLVNAVDTRSRKSLRAWWTYWNVIAKLIGSSEARGAAVGRPLSLLDRALVRAFRYGPSTKCLVATRAH